MELSNTEIKSVAKNMAREMVKRATVKNASRALNSGSYELVSLGGGMYRVQTPSGDLVKDRYGKPLKVSKENNGYAFRDGETLYTNRTKEEVLKYASAKNAMRGAEVTYQTEDGKTGSYRTSINGTDEEIKAHFRVGSKINIGDGPRDRMATIKSVKVLNTAAQNDKSFRAQMNATDIIGWKSLLASIKSGKTKASDYENGLSDEDAIKILEKKISQAR